MLITRYTRFYEVYMLNSKTPDHLNSVVVKEYVDSKLKAQYEFAIQTEALPVLLQENILNVTQSALVQQEGLNFTFQTGNFNGWKTAFDENGDYRWYLKEELGLVTNYQECFLWSSYEFSIKMPSWFNMTIWVDCFQFMITPMKSITI